MKVLLIVFVLIASAGTTLGQAFSPGKIPVWVHHDGSDIIGQRFAYILKETIAKSHIFRLVDGELGYQVVLQSLDPEEDLPRLKGKLAVIGVTFLLYKCRAEAAKYISSTLAVVGANRVQPMAQTVLARLDNDIKDQFGKLTGEEQCIDEARRFGVDIALKAMEDHIRNFGPVTPAELKALRDSLK